MTRRRDQPDLARSARDEENTRSASHAMDRRTQKPACLQEHDLFVRRRAGNQFARPIHPAIAEPRLCFARRSRSMYRRRCSFVIPAYNEARRLPATLAAIADLSISHLGACEIIVVDDGSTDLTAQIASTFRAPQCRMRVLRVPHRGKGFAIRRGVCLARGEIIVLCDADLHESVSEVVFLDAALRSGADIAIGSRWLNHLECVHHQPFFRRVSSRLFNMVAARMMSLPFKDTQCGLKALSRRAAKRVFPLLSLDGWGYDIEMIHCALTLGLHVEEVDLRLVHEYRDSHLRPLVDGWATLWELFKIRRNHLNGAYGGVPVAASALESMAPPVISSPGARQDAA
jgi:glycosyltransferase involved in cell wall biosynthesis